MITGSPTEAAFEEWDGLISLSSPVDLNSIKTSQSRVNAPRRSASSGNVEDNRFLELEDWAYRSVFSSSGLCSVPALTQRRRSASFDRRRRIPVFGSC